MGINNVSKDFFKNISLNPVWWLPILQCKIPIYFPLHHCTTVTKLSAVSGTTQFSFGPNSVSKYNEIHISSTLTKTMITFNTDANGTITRKKSVQEVKCRLEDNSYDNKVTKKLSELKESLSSSTSSSSSSSSCGSHFKLKHVIILNDNRQIDPVDITTINLCDLELW